jgi:hypothetical protein
MEETDRQISIGKLTSLKPQECISVTRRNPLLLALSKNLLFIGENQTNHINNILWVNFRVMCR